MEFITSYPGSFGEVLQGNVSGRDVLLSTPINIYTTAKIFECSNPKDRKRWSKANKLVFSLLKQWGYENNYKNIDINIQSDIPYGKGMASSTADICAVYNCLLKMFNRSFNEDELIRECIKIEPTDSIIFGKATLFDYKKGLYRKTIGQYFSYDILAFEAHGTVDTVEFNSKKLPHLSKTDDLFNILKEGITEKNLSKVAYVSTESIKRNQIRLKYDWINEVEKVRIKTKGVGIIGAHSGNVLGIIYDNKENLDYAVKATKDMKFCTTYSIKTLDEISSKLTIVKSL